MPKNTIIGKRNTPGSNKATGRDYSKETKWQSRPSQVKYRQALNKEARQRGIYGKRHNMGVDLSHKKDGSLRLESRSTNRGRNGKNGKSTKR